MIKHFGTYRWATLIASILILVLVGLVLRRTQDPQRIPTPIAAAIDPEVAFQLRDSRAEKISHLDDLSSEQASIRLQTPVERFVALYGETHAGEKIRILASTHLNAEVEHSIELSSVSDYKSICLLTARSAEELVRKEGSIKHLWDQLTPDQCFARR